VQNAVIKRGVHLICRLVHLLLNSTCWMFVTYDVRNGNNANSFTSSVAGTLFTKSMPLAQ
jgi:hypothetical protein